MAAKRLTLYCPSLDKTQNGFLLTPSATFESFLAEIRAAFGVLPAAWPWTSDGHRIFDITDIKDGQRVQVSTGYFDVVESEEEWMQSVLFWDGAEKHIHHVDQVPRAARYTAVNDMRTQERKDQVVFKGIRVTLPSKLIQAEIAAIANDAATSSYRSEDGNKEVMFTNWKMELGAMWDFNPKVWPQGNADRHLLPNLVLLSDMTSGQALLARKVLLGAIKDRCDREHLEKMEMSVADVEGAITWLLKSAKAGEAKKYRAAKQEASRKEKAADKDASKVLKGKGKEPQGKLDVVTKNKRGGGG